MQIRLHDDFNRLPLDRTDWNALVQRGSVNTIFQTHQWANAWWKTFGDDHRLVYLVAEDDGETRGFVPLMEVPKCGELHLLSDVNSDYCDIVADRNRYAVLDGVLHFLIQEHPGWDSLVLRNIPERSSTLAALLTLCGKHGLHPRLSARIAAPHIDFRQGSRPFKLTYNMRRHSNRLERLGVVDYRVAQERAELPAMLDELYKQHIGRYREKGERSLFENTACRRFYATLADDLLDTGWLHFSQLRLDGRPLATHFGFVYNKVLTWYKPAFDVAYSRYSPGTVLIRRLIDYAGAHDLDTLDFTIGNEPFKERFRNAIAYNRTLTIFRNRSSAYWHVAKDRCTLATRHVRDFLRRTYA